MTTLIVGGGLSGLALARALHAQDKPFMLLEARSRWGGRILTETHGTAAFDMGPAWFWPGQPRIAALIQQLGLKVFEQYATGDLLFEEASGQVRRGRGFASMQGSLRLAEGMGALVAALMTELPQLRTRLDAAVTHLARRSDGVSATLDSGEVITGDRLVLALPPRVAATLDFASALPAPTLEAMTGIATWMAGQAKALAVYDTPFWREAGLSGDLSSRHGPVVELHDASPATGGPYALFGFIGVPPEARQDQDALRRAILAQLNRCFGEQASRPAQLWLKDWAFDHFTATAQDSQPLYAHPTYGLPRAMQELWNGRLHFAGTEVAPQFGGYLEGALEAAEMAVSQLKASGLS